MLEKINLLHLHLIPYFSSLGLSFFPQNPLFNIIHFPSLFSSLAKAMTFLAAA